MPRNLPFFFVQVHAIIERSKDFRLKRIKIGEPLIFIHVHVVVVVVCTIQTMYLYLYVWIRESRLVLLYEKCVTLNM